MEEVNDGYRGTAHVRRQPGEFLEGFVRAASEHVVAGGARRPRALVWEQSSCHG
jgi:hypothetical protein